MATPYRAAKSVPPVETRSEVAGWSPEFTESVFPAEYRTIMERRHEVAKRTAAHEGRSFDEAVDGPPERKGDGPLVPSVALRLFGLAFSGGGVRSSTFNLGVLQALAKHGLLPRFDYLSTVSGGGYVGSCLSSLLNRPDADSRWSRAFPLHMESGRQEPIALRHLRNNSQHLLSAESQGYFGMAAVSLRGMLINVLALLPWVVLVVGFTWLAYGSRLEGGLLPTPPGYPLTLAALVVFGLAAGLFPLLAWLVGQRARTPELATRRGAGAVYGVLLVVVVVLALLESLPLVLRWYHQGVQTGPLLSGLAGLSMLGVLLPTGTASQGNGSDRSSRVRIALAGLAAVAAGPLVLVLVYVVLAEWVVFPGSSPMSDAVTPWVVFGGGAAVLAYVALWLDPNATSVYQFYRDRLSHTYLFEVDPAEPGAVRSTDRLRLSQLNAPGTVAPYHLVNVTLNLQSSTDVTLRGRMADFFVLSKHHTGSARTGYCATAALEALDPRVDLGAAMAISGAVATPLMGTLAIRPLALLVTLLNLRMSYWLVHPRRVAAGKGWGLLGRVGVGLHELLREATGRADEHGRTVNLSDGGHIENLGIYELLRRRCRVIVCGDGEGDPDMAFGGLAIIIRYAATDMGVHIDIDLRGIATDAEGRSAQHHAIGRIDYGDGEVGWLLYIKQSIGRRELPYVEQYRHANPDFPHESTADQFFDEAQFEAYRALGFKVGERTMEALAALMQQANDEDLLAFDSPGVTVTPGGDPVEERLRQGFGSASDPDPPW